MYLRAMRSDGDHKSLLLGSNFDVNFCHLPRITLRTHNSTATQPLETKGLVWQPVEYQANILGTGVSLTEHTANPSRILIKEVAAIWRVKTLRQPAQGSRGWGGTTLDWWDASCRDSAWLVRTRSFPCYFKPSQVELLWLCFLGMKNQ